MAAFDELLGQEAAQATLIRALSTNKVHHAYRFEGPSGVGKAFAARLLARALVCDKREGCGLCSACSRAMTLAQDGPEVSLHPDILFVGRGIYPSSIVGSAETTGISVDQIRKIVLPRMGFGPHEGRALVVLIFAADELTLAAANSLLKTLEEPPPNTHFILITSRPKRLLDTIASRTIRVRFGPLPKHALSALLADAGPSLTEDILDRAQGSLERARSLMNEEERAAYAAFTQAVERAVAARDPSAAVRFAESRPSDRDGLLDQLRFLGSSYAMGARMSGASDPEGLARSASRYALVDQAMRKIEQNASPALALETLIIRLTELSS